MMANMVSQAAQGLMPNLDNLQEMDKEDLEIMTMSLLQQFGGDLI